MIGDSGGRPVLDHVPGPRLDVLIQEGTAREETLVAAGRSLGTLHGAEPPTGLGRALAEAPPWEPLGSATWLGLSATQRRLVGVFHTDDELRTLGRSTRDLLRHGNVWIHGDARTSNFCVSADGGPLLVDWETAGLGRAEADLGALAAAVMTDTLLTLKEPPGKASRIALAAAMNRAARSIRLVLDGYRAVRREPVDDDLLAASVGCSLLTRSFMRASATRWERVLMAQYELGRGLVTDPARWKVIDRHG
ncbi:phosphotransferase [Prauserella cavernicola]|uniref:Phosphotransferase n=1 Tax=Prauserella cavernicola TaxID=2800127 RepID=A0A934QWN8_9PSEU|nr:phosphotransferase [Prauserella cavernicola]